MPLYSERNLYPGINAHLNSFLQDEDGGWESFHAQYIVKLCDEIEDSLPGDYYTRIEKSLQLNQVGIEAIDEDDYITAVVIYEITQKRVPGRPVTRIELLSPTNKPPNSGYAHYVARRVATLRSGLTLVEIDFLHEQRPIIPPVPSYPDGQPGAYPYTVIVSNPHPTVDEGEMSWYGWGVDDELPVIPVPLSGKDQVLLNLAQPYNRLIERVRVFRMIVDYDELPIHFDRYAPADQERIRQRLAALRQREHGQN